MSRKYLRSEREPAPCGTEAAARRHWRNGEPIDDACRHAARRARSQRAGHAGTGNGELVPDLRERRNGLPEFRPYVYRGLGYDIYDPEDVAS